MNPDPASLSNLHDIVAPPPASWWPLASGWYLVMGLILIVTVSVSLRAWRRWKADAYRREALRLLDEATDASQVARTLKRTALAAFPRSEVASLTGDRWCDWLESRAPGPISPDAREALIQSLFGRGDIDIGAMRHYAINWVEQHRRDLAPERGPS